MDNADTQVTEEAQAMPDQASITPEAGRRSRPSSRHKRCWPLWLGGMMLLFQGCASTPTMSPSEEARAQAKIAYLLSDYQRTLAIALPRAEAGEAWAEYTLGYLYYYGQGVRQDRQTAKRWIESAANKGYAPAQQAMLRLSAPPPAENSSAQEPLASPQPPPPATGQTQPATPQMTEPPSALQPPAAPSAPAIPTPATPPQTTPPAPAQDPAPPSVSPQSAVDPPPRTTVPGARPATIAPPRIAVIPAPDVKGREWLANQNPANFTLQLASSLDKDALLHLIRQRRIEQHAAYYATRQNGRTWYALIYGSFTSRASAHQALRNLPRSLRRNSPRIRSFREIPGLLSPAP